MSLHSAKAFKSGIIIPKNNSFILLVPIELKIPKTKKETFQESINRKIFYVFYRNTTHYTIHFNRDKNNKPQIQINLFFQAGTIDKLSNTAKQSLQTIKRNLNNLDIDFRVIDTSKYLQSIMSTIPKEITSKTNSIYKIKTSKITFFTTIFTIFLDSQQRGNDLLAFLKDFYSHLKMGTIAIDIIKDQNLKGTKLGIKVAVIIMLKSNTIQKLRENQFKINSLLMLLFPNDDDGKKPYKFISKNELQSNFGKIIIGQGWKFSPLKETSWLNFAEYFNLLVDFY